MWNFSYHEPAAPRATWKGATKLLDRYVESDADRAEVMRAMRGMAAITVESHVAIDPG